MSSRHEKEKGVNVQVLLRCRPFSDDELRNNAPQVVTCNEYQREVSVSQNIAGKHIDRTFIFDKSGPNGELPPGAGVIPRAVKQIFDTLEGQCAEYSVKVTFLELYNEEITDLLAPDEISKIALEEKQKKQLPLMEDGKGGVLVRGLEEEIVTSAFEIFTLLERGSAKRRTAETLLNKQSSRSHSLFSVTIHIKEATPEGEELIKCGKLNLVDLAGSENISRSGAREVCSYNLIAYAQLPGTGFCFVHMLSWAQCNQLFSSNELLYIMSFVIASSFVLVIVQAMADQIEQMTVTMENHQKKTEELQGKYDDQVQQCCALSNKLDATQKDLDSTTELLSNTEDELRLCKYSLKERDFIISEQKKAENALAHQACVLRADLEKSQKDNASLFLKIAREDKLNADNRSTVNTFTFDLTQQLNTISSSLVASVSRQREHLQCVENLCNSFLQIHDKAYVELKQKVSSSRALYVSHFEAVQNVVHLHKAGSNAALEELSALASCNSQSIEAFLAAEAVEVKSVFNDLHDILSSHQGEMAHLARELRQRFIASTEHLTSTSESIHGCVDKILEESKRLKCHATKVDEIQMKSIAEFRNSYEEQSKSEAEKLIADMTSLVSKCMLRQKEMVEAKLDSLKDSAIGNKIFLDGHVSTIDGITTDLKRKWQDSFSHADSSFKENADFSAAKHCRMELLMQKCGSSADTALKRWQTMQESLNDMGKQNSVAIDAHVRNMHYSNEQHDAEVESARELVEEDIKRNSYDIIQCFDGLSEQEKSSVSEVLSTSKEHSETIQNLLNDHSQQSACIEQHAIDTFGQKYADYEPTGMTPVRSEPDIPGKETIESLRAVPMEALQEEFRENHPFESVHAKQVKPPVAPREPLLEIN
ncbi:hypothetical protein SASPL_124836 [Salvia splendens]|uniref:Kinesin-like protein n=1 Tax=Salvia splendens TaxID=180675 RepID=A0A8X8ZPK1_SALSN|nr:hypothetical protein SASPL_124836 [Salvia splendens]